MMAVMKIMTYCSQRWSRRNLGARFPTYLQDYYYWHRYYTNPGECLQRAKKAQEILTLNFQKLSSSKYQCRDYVRNKIISKFSQPSSTSDWNNFISAPKNLSEIISKLFRKLIAAHDCPTCSMSLKYFWNNFSGWKNFISVSDVVTVWNKTLK